MAARRYILVTASDDTYAPLALDLVRSLRRLTFPFFFDIGVLDLGLGDAAKDELAAFGVCFATPGLDIDYPGRAMWEQQAPFYRAMTSRPFLRDYFTGYEAYMWMDADSWAQTPDAVITMLSAAASDDALYIAAEMDRDYTPCFHTSQPWEYHFKWYNAHFPADMVAKIFPRPMLNTGVLALAPQSPVWSEWAAVFKNCLSSLPQLTRENFMSEQLSLNMALHLKNLPFKVMPSEFNWLSLYALPMVDVETNTYVRPTVPRTLLSVIHITHQKKLRELDLLTTDGGATRRVLTFTDYVRHQLPLA